MRDVTSIETPNLFSPELMGEPSAESTIERDERAFARIARDFVRWCCSFGPDFRNSPDITNLRSWQQKNRIASSLEDDEILVEARRLFLKKLEQAVRKADVRKETD